MSKYPLNALKPLGLSVTPIIYGHCSFLCQNGFAEGHPARIGPGAPVMPQTIRIRLAQSIEIGTVSDESGTTLDDEKLICPYEYEFAPVGLIPVFESDSPLNALLPDG